MNTKKPVLLLEFKPALTAALVIDSFINNYAERVACEDRLLAKIDNQISTCGDKYARFDLEHMKRDIHLNKAMLVEALNRFKQVKYLTNNEAMQNV